MDKDLYPLQFEPILVEKLWGGNLLGKRLGKDCREHCGESWEISGVRGHVSVVSNGPLEGKDLNDLIAEYGHKLLGTSVQEKFGNEFPLLFKFLDTQKVLSVQVHPNDEQAMESHGSRGKTEMWYIIHAEPGSKLIAGVKPGNTAESLRSALDEGRVIEELVQVDVSTGDVFYIPAGLVHTIGKGILLAEIQETSDITYRMYDFDRPGLDGKPRQLHIDEALEVCNLNESEQEARVSYDQESVETNLVSCPYFTTRRISFEGKAIKNYADIDSFVVYMLLEGQLSVKYNHGESIAMETGASILIPASLDQVEISSEGCLFLEITIEA